MPSLTQLVFKELVVAFSRGQQLNRALPILVIEMLQRTQIAVPAKARQANGLSSPWQSRARPSQAAPGSGSLVCFAFWVVCSVSLSSCFWKVKNCNTGNHSGICSVSSFFPFFWHVKCSTKWPVELRVSDACSIALLEQRNLLRSPGQAATQTGALLPGNTRNRSRTQFNTQVLKLKVTIVFTSCLGLHLGFFFSEKNP